MPRLSVIISEEEQARIHRLIPWGIQSSIIRLLLTRSLDLVEKHGDVVFGALLAGKLSILDLLKAGGEEEK